MSDDEMKPLEVDHAEEALILRPERSIAILPLPAGGSAFVQALKNGRTFGESVVAAADVANDFDLTACLHQLLSAQAFVAINVAH